MNREMNGKESGVKIAQNKHPLMEFVPITFNSFEEWLTRWNGTAYLAEKLGLLHSLTTKNGWYLEPELVLLLLSVADGYADGVFSDDEIRDPYYQRNEAKNRKIIAEKAFSVLCLRFFRGNEEHEGPLWLWMLKHEVLFQKVLWFLRKADGFNYLYNCSYIRCNSDDHQYRIFRNFMKEFSRLGWEFRCPEFGRLWGRWNEKTENLVKQRLIAARPQLIDVLCELGELNWLDGKDVELDAKSLKKLTEMALGNNLFLPPEKVSDSSCSLRKPKSLKEAVLGGSVAAQIVLLHQIKENERKRIGALYKTSQKQHRDQRKAEELDAIRKRQKELDEKARSLTKPSNNKS